MTVFTPSHTQFQLEKEKTQMLTSPFIAALPGSYFTETLPNDVEMGVGSNSILIVDDDAEVRISLRKGLEVYGYYCKEAEDGLVALRQLRAHSYDVVLTDLNMPFLDGLGLAQHLMEDSSLGNPMIIMMTPGPTEMITRLALTFGIQEILLKPCLPSDVDRIIHPQEIKFPWAA